MNLKEITEIRFVDHLLVQLQKEGHSIPSKEILNNAFYFLYKEDRVKPDFFGEDYSFDWDKPFPNSPTLSEALINCIMMYGLNFDNLNRLNLGEGDFNHHMEKQKEFDSQLADYFAHAVERVKSEISNSGKISQ